MKANVWVVIPAHRAAIGHLRENLEVLGDQLTANTVVVTNGLHPLTEYEVNTHLIQAGPEINISRWWNLGLDKIWEFEIDPHTGKVRRHHVLILNADARIRPEGVARLSWALDTNRGYVIAFPKAGIGIGHEHIAGVREQELERRMTGWCFMIDGTSGIRADERFRWWCGDNDLEWRARQGYGNQLVDGVEEEWEAPDEGGGTLAVGRIEAAHHGDGMPQGECLTLARQDLVTFEEKWSTRPF